MKNRIAIKLKNNGNNNFSFQEVTEILPEENCITINGKNYQKLIANEDLNINIKKINKDGDLYLVFDLDILINQAIKDGVPKEDAKNYVKTNLSKLASSVKSIDAEFADSMISLSLSFEKKKKREININAIDPNQVINDIKKNVVAQDEVLDDVVRFIHRNQIIIESNTPEDAAKVKGNVLIDGPTGTGKTYIMQEVAKHMNLPIVITQSTMYTSTGYRGVELKQMLEALLKETDGDLEAAQRGIVVLDEFDKLGNGKGDSPLEIRKAVQQDLLTYMSGSKFPVEYKGKTYDFDTSRVTFVCLGAFTDYREKQVGNSKDATDYEMYSDDYVKAGIMREMVGRFKLMRSTKKYTREALKQILTNSANSPLKNLISIGKKSYNTNIVFDDTIIDIIVEYAYNMNTGARSLQNVVGDLEVAILKDLEANRRKSVETDFAITLEIVEKATAKYKNEQERKGKKL